MTKQVKLIQSRLSRLGVKVSLAEIREHIAVSYNGDELTPEQISAIVEELSSSSTKLATVKKSQLSQTEKRALVQQVASSLEIELPVEEIREISQKLNWTISDRASLKEQIGGAIIAWVDYQIDKDKQQTDEMFEDVETHLSTRLNESNQHFKQRTAELSSQLGVVTEKFCATRTEILDLFQIPN